MRLIDLFSNVRIRRIVSFSFPTYLTSALSLISFPLIANKLGVKDFGQFDLFLLSVTVLNFSLQFGWTSAHNRFYHEETINQDDLVKTLLISRISIFILLISTALVFHYQFLAWIGLSNDESMPLWLIILIFIVTDFSNLFTQRYRMRNASRSFFFFTVSKAVLYFISILFVLFFWIPTPVNLLIVTLISSFTPLLCALVFDRVWLLSGTFRTNVFRRITFYGLPLVPSALALMGLQLSDRLMLRSLIPDVDISLPILGNYAFALRLVAITSLATSGFRILWAPYLYKTYKKPGSPVIYSNIFSAYLFILALISFFIVSISYYFIPIHMNEFAPSLDVLAILLASVLIYNIGDYFPVGIDVAEKTWIRACCGIVCLVSNILLNIYLIPRFNALGAASATFISTVVYISLLMLISHRFYPVNYSYSSLAFISLSILVLSPARFLASGYYTIVFILALMLSLFLAYRDLKGSNFLKIFQV